MVLGRTGRNFAAGMSGGFAYVYDEDGGFRRRCNHEMVDLEDVVEEDDLSTLRGLIKQHFESTGSTKAQTLLQSWDEIVPRVRKDIPPRLQEGHGRAEEGKGSWSQQPMGKPTGFKEFGRESPKRRLVQERIRDYREFYQEWPEQEIRDQGARCMSCAVPFCHTGCPLGNIIPDWNDLVYRGHWKEALDALHATNNFPEFTGRICPAPCETACVLAINQDPVTIEYIEKAIADRGFDEGWIVPEPPQHRNRPSGWQSLAQAPRGWLQHSNSTAPAIGSPYMSGTTTSVACLPWASRTSSSTRPS